MSIKQIFQKRAAKARRDAAKAALLKEAARVLGGSPGARPNPVRSVDPSTIIRPGAKNAPPSPGFASTQNHLQTGIRRFRQLGQMPSRSKGPTHNPRLAHKDEIMRQVAARSQARAKAMGGPSVDATTHPSFGAGRIGLVGRKPQPAAPQPAAAPPPPQPSQVAGPAASQPVNPPIPGAKPPAPPAGRPVNAPDLAAKPPAPPATPRAGDHITQEIPRTWRQMGSSPPKTPSTAVPSTVSNPGQVPIPGQKPRNSLADLMGPLDPATGRALDGPPGPPQEAMAGAGAPQTGPQSATADDQQFNVTFPESQVGMGAGGPGSHGTGQQPTFPESQVGMGAGGPGSHGTGQQPTIPESQVGMGAGGPGSHGTGQQPTFPESQVGMGAPGAHGPNNQGTPAPVQVPESQVGMGTPGAHGPNNQGTPATEQPPADLPEEMQMAWRSPQQYQQLKGQVEQLVQGGTFDPKNPQHSQQAGELIGASLVNKFQKLMPTQNRGQDWQTMLGSEMAKLNGDGQFDIEDIENAVPEFAKMLAGGGGAAAAAGAVAGAGTGVAGAPGAPAPGAPAPAPAPGAPAPGAPAPAGAPADPAAADAQAKQVEEQIKKDPGLLQQMMDWWSGLDRPTQWAIGIGGGLLLGGAVSALMGQGGIGAIMGLLGGGSIATGLLGGAGPVAEALGGIFGGTQPNAAAAAGGAAGGGAGAGGAVPGMGQAATAGAQAAGEMATNQPQMNRGGWQDATRGGPVKAPPAAAAGAQAAAAGELPAGLQGLLSDNKLTMDEAKANMGELSQLPDAQAVQMLQAADPGLKKQLKRTQGMFATPSMIASSLGISKADATRLKALVAQAGI